MEPLHHNRGLALSLSKGYTITELLVVLAIVGVISSFVAVSQSTFNKTLILANTAYDVALTVQSAETYGIGGRGGTSSDANVGYGVHFQKIPGNSITLFMDAYPSSAAPSSCHPVADAFAPNPVPGNCQYDPSNGEKILDYTIGNGITISDFCAYTGNGNSKRCMSGPGNGNSISSLDIVFARPNPNPFIRASDGNLYSSACLTISSADGTSRYVSVQASGQIIPKAAPCL